MNEAEQDADQGHRARSGYKVQIAGADLEFHATALNDPMPTGRQVAQASGEGDPAELIVLQQLPDFQLEELRLDETTDLRGRGIERFIVAKSDRTFRFLVGDLKLEWPFSNPTALIIKTLVGKGEDFDLVQLHDDGPEHVIADESHVHLEGRGTERFRLRKRVRHVTVKYNHTPFTLEARMYTTEELLAIFQVQAGYILDRIASDGDFIEMKPGDKVRVVDCMEFVSHAPCGGAS